MTISFRVTGRPKPGGSKRGFVRGGRAVVVEASKNVPWIEAVKFAAQSEYQGPLLDEPLALSVDFYFARPKGHFGTGKNAGNLKPSAPSFPAKMPDLSKIVRSTEDAMTGVIYRDDALIVTQSFTKRYSIDGREGAEILIQTIEEAEREVMPEKPKNIGGWPRDLPRAATERGD